jgi:hypothetical protein
MGCVKAIPPVPVVRIEVVSAILNIDTRKALKEYLSKRPEVKYILLDGSHKTTAATLNHQVCMIAVIENDSDVEELIAMESRGEIFQHIIGNSMKEIVRNIKRHLEERKVFQTVEEKTIFLVDKKEVPQFMIDKYREGK